MRPNSWRSTIILHKCSPLSIKWVRETQEPSGCSTREISGASADEEVDTRAAKRNRKSSCEGPLGDAKGKERVIGGENA